jgi:hypothetical protein
MKTPSFLLLGISLLMFLPTQGSQPEREGDRKIETVVWKLGSEVPREVIESRKLLTSISDIDMKKLRQVNSEIGTYLKSYDSLTGSDYVSANKGVQYFYDLRSPKILARGLSNTNAGIQLQSTTYLLECGDPTVLKELIDCLERNNFVQQGSEEATIHQNLLGRLIAAIGKFQGTEYAFSNVHDTKRIADIIQDARAKLK